jgi:pyruvate dehydrogenase E2 component (dihydrolipoamide acetyltransferase)
MLVEIHMPALAESMTEGTLARWLKRVGESVAAGEAIAEVESDKATLEIEAPRAGVIAELRVGDGASRVKVGTVIATLSGREDGLAAGSEVRTREAPPPADGVREPRGPESSPMVGRGPERIFASPAARRLARERGLDLGGLRGSGPGGRIVMADVQGAPSRPPLAAPRAMPALEAPPPAPPACVPAEELEAIPHTAMRRVTAERLAEAKRTIPHFYLTIDCRLDELLALRREIKASGPSSDPSVTDLLVRAVALAIRAVPAVNASFTERAVLRRRAVDVAVAVATRHGLITPVVREADHKGVLAIALEMKTLVERARDQQLSPDEYLGAGFTLTNLGMYGIREFAAIINPPQACILAVGAGEPRPVVRDGAIAIATMMTCTLSADHRVVDGAIGAEFLQAFKSLVERPLALLL